MGIAEAVAAMGAGPLTEAALAEHVRPLFSRSLAGGEIYLANHTLGRMPDQTFADVQEGLEVWASEMRGAWVPWLTEERRYRQAVGDLLGVRGDVVVPKASAGAALRAVLNTLEPGATVLTTGGEFESVRHVLARYRAIGRIQLHSAEPAADGRWTAEALLRALTPETELVVVSHVFYTDGQVFDGMERLAAGCRAVGARLLVDSYHAVGALPFAFAGLGCDYLIGGCYKYLRGGPGAAFLVLSPEIADGPTRTLDTGWFAGEPGGDRWLEGTPMVLSYYQARAGLALARALGVGRVRAYSLRQLAFFRERLARLGVRAAGGDAQHGAFVTVACAEAESQAVALAAQNIAVNAREGRLRICPDVLTTQEELAKVAEAIGRRLAG